MPRSCRARTSVRPFRRFLPVAIRSSAENNLGRSHSSRRRSAVSSFQSAREFLLAHRENYPEAYRSFEWPAPEEFNWALDWFDTLPADDLALWIVEEDGSEQKWTFGELSDRSGT